MTNTSSPPKKRAANIRTDKLRTFEGHPFQVLDDEDMNSLTESIKAQGIISPLIVRPIENTDEYEVVSGHRRLHAAVKAGLTEVPALIYPLDRNEAMIAVVDSNLHREHLPIGTQNADAGIAGANINADFHIVFFLFGLILTALID